MGTAGLQGMLRRTIYTGGEFTPYMVLAGLAGALLLVAFLAFFFNNVSLDGYFVDHRGDMSWAHQRDAEWGAFTSENASGGGELVFGRVTYEMMAGFWTSPAARETLPDVVVCPVVLWYEPKVRALGSRESGQA
jgi:heme/copper-type cytochrome/quinol oxidase subunit 1